MADGMNEVVAGNPFEDSFLGNPREQPSSHPPARDLLGGLLYALLGQKKPRMLVHTEQVRAGVLDQLHSIDQARAAVVQEVVGGQSECVQAVPQFPEPRIHSLTEDAVDLLASLRLGNHQGKFGNRLVAELECADTPCSPKVFVADSQSGVWD